VIVRERSAAIAPGYAVVNVHTVADGKKLTPAGCGDGLITLGYETVTVDATPDQTLFLFSAEPDTADAASLELLAGIARESSFSVVRR
jgi:hypothetical protein